MKRAQRYTVGSVRLDKRRKTWNYLDRNQAGIPNQGSSLERG